MIESIRDQIEHDVTDYLLIDSSQSAIQVARTELRMHRLGRAPRTNWEQQQVATVWLADKLLRSALSDTISKNIYKRGVPLMGQIREIS